MAMIMILSTTVTASIYGSPRFTSRSCALSSFTCPSNVSSLCVACDYLLLTKNTKTKTKLHAVTHSVAFFNVATLCDTRKQRISLSIVSYNVAKERKQQQPNKKNEIKGGQRNTTSFRRTTFCVWFTNWNYSLTVMRLRWQD